MTVEKDFIKLLKSEREKEHFSTYLDDKTLRTFAKEYDLYPNEVIKGRIQHDIDKINNIIKDNYTYTYSSKMFGDRPHKFKPLAVKPLKKSTVNDALKEIKDISPKNESSTYPPKNTGSATEWKYYVGKNAILAKGYYNGWQGKCLFFLKGYGWCRDIEYTHSTNCVKSEIETFDGMPKQIFIKHDI